MQLVMMGSGYVGLVSGSCFSKLGHQVTCLDINKERIEKLNRGEVPIYEPGLDLLIKEQVEKKLLSFSNDNNNLKHAQAIFLAVGTPGQQDGSANLSYLMSAVEEVAKLAAPKIALIIKSTVPVQTASTVEKFLKELNREDIVVLNNPEFLREGVAIDDFMHPDRVVIGARNELGFLIARKIYEPLIKYHPSLKYIEMNNESAELTKYAANAFLAVKISFMNEMLQLCERTGADILEVKNGVGSDLRIGEQFISPGPGYGGSCFPKDVEALLYTAKKVGLEIKVAQSARIANSEMRSYVVTQFLKRLTLLNKSKDNFPTWFKEQKIAILGLSFKAETDDIRDSSALVIIERLLDEGIGQLSLYDPQGMSNTKEYFAAHAKKNCLQFQTSAKECLQGASALIILTEWNEFKVFPLEMIKQFMGLGLVFDARLLLNKKQALGLGINYWAIGDSELRHD